MTKNNNIILIGMPGAGKSTVGVVLAKNMGYHFVDSDLVIQAETGKLLSEIIEEKGLDGFKDIEDEVNAGIEAEKTVISTGGSVVYCEKAMAHFSDIGKIVYLDVSYEALQKRLGDLNKRGVAIKEGYTLKDLYNERKPLYEKYADIQIHVGKKNIPQTIKAIKKALEG